MSEGEKKKRRLSLSRAIMLSLVLGIACGIFFGEFCAPLKVVGDVFIGLLQMTVLPYIVLALIVNIGSLQIGSAKSLAKWGAMTMLILWGITVAAVLIMPLALPEWKSGSFFSSSLVQEAEVVDLLKLYVPVNPFGSLANNIVPASVLFCIAVGTALIGAKNTKTLIEPLRVALDAMGRITKWVAQLTPIGVFALSASAAGTLTISQFGRLQGYVILYIAAAVILSFVVFPAVVAAITPFRMRDVVSVSKDALLTALATENVFIVLPLLIEGAKELFEQYDLASEQTDQEVEVAMPLAFPFPNAGRLLAMIFIPFAAWFTGRTIAIWDYPNLIVSGISSLFAKVTIAIPFLLDLVQLPADLFNLFLLAGILAGRFGSLAGAMHLFAFTIITAAGVTGLVRVRHRGALTGALLSVAVVAATIFVTRSYLEGAIAKISSEESVITRMQLYREPASATVLERPATNPVPLREGQTLLERIQERGILRVGFHRQALPYAFFTGDGDLVGFDVEMAHRLALDLGVSLEFVPLTLEDVDQWIALDYFDVVMSGVIANAGRYAEWLFTEAYLDVSPALVVPDHERGRFDTLAEATSGQYGLAVIDEPALLKLVRRKVPRVSVIPISDLTDFFEGRLEGADALLATAESGSAWTLLYPDFHVATPWKELPKWPLGYIVGGHDVELREFLDNWIYLKKSDGTIHELYNHWILGRTAEPYEPRWSVIRDVLHWVE